MIMAIVLLQLSFCQANIKLALTWAYAPVELNCSTFFVMVGECTYEAIQIIKKSSKLSFQQQKYLTNMVLLMGYEKGGCGKTTIATTEC